MITPFLYLAGLMIATAYPLGFEPLGFAERMVAPWALLGLLVVYGGICRAVLSWPLRRPGLAMLALQVLALVAFAQLVFVFHLPLWIWELGAEESTLISSLLTLLPLMLLYGILALVELRAAPRSGGLRSAFRSFLWLGFLPILLILVLNELFERVGPLRRIVVVYPAASWGLLLGSLGLALVFAPPLLRLILGARPLPPGPLRERLEHMGERAGYRATDLLVVPFATLRMANAFVVGLSARWRYIFFTESIIAGMSPEELECVVLHEITHNRKRHLAYFLLLAVVYALVSGLAGELFEAAGVPLLAMAMGMLIWTAAYWRLGFGFVSRRFEMEADLVASRTAPALEGSPSPYGAARRMAQALERCSALNGVPLEMSSWRQYSVEKRIDILLHAEIDPSTGARFERDCDRLRTRMKGLLLVGLLCGGILMGLQFSRAPENRALLAARESAEQGRRLLDQQRYEEARRELQRGIDGHSDSGLVWVWLADCERALGREEAAREAEATARRKGVTDPRIRLRLRLQ